MSDYLNNLLARTRNLAPVVQPRPASLFEPAAIAASGTPRPALETEAAHESPHAPAPSSHEIAQPPAPQANQSTSRHAQATVMMPTPLLARNRSDDGKPPDGRADSAGGSLKPPAASLPASSTMRLPQPSRSSETEPGPLTKLRALSDSPRSPAPTPAATGREASVRVTASSDEENWSRLEPKVRQLLGEQLSGLRPSRAYERSSEVNSQPTATRRAVASHLTAEAQDARPVKPSQTFDGQPEAAGSLPSINVTIGRVEVRAIISAPPPAPAPRPAQRNAALSLDDYLKQRSGGRR
jgi:hypothetical protein